MLLGSSKVTNQNQEPKAPVGGVKPVVEFGGGGGKPAASVGILTDSNMGNILVGGKQQQTALAMGPAAGGAAIGKSTLNNNSRRAVAGGAGKMALGAGGIGGTKNNVTRLGSTGSSATLQPKGNPTGGGGGAALRTLSSTGTGTVGPTTGRNFVSVVKQALAGSQAQKPLENKVYARPAQRFKIRKDTIASTSQQLVNTNASKNVVLRRPFAGKAVDVTRPATVSEGNPAKVQTEMTSGSVDEPDRTSSSTLSTLAEELQEKVSLEEPCEKLEDESKMAVGNGEPTMVVGKPDGSGLIRDIDRNDDSPQLVSEYVNDITNYLFRVEEKTFKIKNKYLDGSKLNGRMRAVLLDWLVQVHLQFAFKQETIFITANVLDRFLMSDHSIERHELQLVGVAALFIAVKFEEIHVPHAQDFTNVSDGAFDILRLVRMEQRILDTLKFDLSPPIPSFFLRRCSKAAGTDITGHQLAKYICELAMIDYSSAHIRPSMLAAAALGLAMMILTRRRLSEFWSPTLQFYSHYKVSDITPVIGILSNVLASAYESDGKLQGVRRKYASSKFLRISCLESIAPEKWKHWVASELKTTPTITITGTSGTTFGVQST